tara:strand:+ start:105 stop:839 length:735 start_codon:yes stop_codon:yes gene_type:complete
LIKQENIGFLLKRNSFNRFYENVSIKNYQNNFLIFLDENQLLSPKNNIISYPSLDLIKLIANEWDKQKETVNINNMLASKLFFTALDKVRPNLSKAIDDLSSFIDFDLLCYQVQSPCDLKKLQDKNFSPIISWISTEYKVTPNINNGIISHSNNRELKSNLRELLRSFDFIELTLLEFLINLLGSIILGIAFLKGRLSDLEIISLIYLEEDWKTRLSGDKDYTSDAKKNIKFDMEVVQKILNLK